jgi:hypothetical protein
LGRLIANDDPPEVVASRGPREGRFFGFGRLVCSGAGGEEAMGSTGCLGIGAADSADRKVSPSLRSAHHGLCGNGKSDSQIREVEG